MIGKAFGRLVVVVVCAACIGGVVPEVAPAARRLEMVSPLYKGGYGATQIVGVRSDGDAIAYYSPGAFNGAPAGLSEGLDFAAYMAVRTPSGWSTSPLMVPDALSPVVLGNADFYSTLDRELAVVQLPDVEDPSQLGNRDEFFMHPTGSADAVSNWQPAGVTLESTTKAPNLIVEYTGASSDFCHILFTADEPLLAEAEGAKEQLYEMVTGCHGEAAELRLVALNQNHKLISPACESDAGIKHNSESGPSAFNAISDEGRQIFFTSCVPDTGKDLLDHQLFVRLDGTRTVEISRPLSPTLEKCGEEIPCKGAGARASADFAGASQDGSVVFFTSKAPLTGEGEGDRGLYMATVGCPEAEPECAVSDRVVTSLERVSRSVNVGGRADVQGVVRVSTDGSRVYFVARGVLAEGSNAQGVAAVDGADNLYMYERDQRYPAGRVVFVATLCSGAGASGEAEDGHCPGGTGDTLLWAANNLAEAQTAGRDGRFLVFSSYGQLVVGDTDSGRDVYRYDGETGALERVSVGEAGYHSDGNDSEFDARLNGGHRGESVTYQYELDNRAISEDGSRIVFTTSEPLSSRAISGLSNVYEWHAQPTGVGGEVTLLSGGAAETPIEDAVISPQGGDVFFDTTQGLVPQDTDGAPDVYDAREGGGFPEPPASREQCSSDACQGALTSPVPLLVPGSVSQAPEANPVIVKRAKAKPRKRHHPRRKRRRHQTKRAVRKASRSKAGRVSRGGRR